MQVIYDILRKIQEKDGKIKPTHIMYKANLSHKMLDEYLTELMEKKLVIEHDQKTGKTYGLSDKGHEFIAKYKMVTEFLESFGL